MKDKIFHQIVRYEYARCAINSMRTKRKHSILEVGAGAHGNLANYLPEDAITFLDLNLPEEILSDSRFVIGDATELAYAEESFDFVIALDVLEHIPSEKRKVCIENLHRVAKLGVVLSVPHYCIRDRYEDDLLKTFYLLCGMEPPIWIDEHIDCILPKEEELIQSIKSQGVAEESILKFYGVKRTLMMKMLIFEAVASKYNEALKFFDVMNSDYISSIMFQDVNLEKDDAMKLYIIWRKNGSIKEVEEKIGEVFSANKANVDSFEAKYSELMEWVLSLETLSFCDRIYSNIEKDSNVLKMLLEEQTKKRESDSNFLINVESLLKDTEAIQKAALECMESTLKNISSAVENVECEIKKISDEKKKIRVNVILITYNHSQFIEETLKTILMQETEWGFNILVADDCSTDDTVSIIKKMEKQTEIPFVYLPNDHNLGIMKNYRRAFEACDAEYVAIMEGDDLWTDKLRLQKHVEFLDEHTECSMSFNRYVVRNFADGTSVMQPRFFGTEEMHYYKYISGHDLAYNNLIGNFSTCVYRTGALKALPEEMFSIECYDWLTNIMVSRTGYIGCLMQPMSIYRIHSSGVWSGQNANEKIRSTLKVIDLYDEYTGREFTAGFTAHKQRLETALISSIPGENPRKFTEPIKRVLRSMYRISNYLPPVFTYIIGLLIPNAVKSRINEVL